MLLLLVLPLCSSPLVADAKRVGPALARGDGGREGEEEVEEEVGVEIPTTTPASRSLVKAKATTAEDALAATTPLS